MFKIKVIILITVNITLNHAECQGSKCGACAYVCPTNVFVIKENKICVNSPQYLNYVMNVWKYVQPQL
jgi:ferredoxin